MTTQIDVAQDRDR